MDGDSQHIADADGVSVQLHGPVGGTTDQESREWGSWLDVRPLRQSVADRGGVSQWLSTSYMPDRALSTLMQRSSY